jgi:hypothetical protein
VILGCQSDTGGRFALPPSSSAKNPREQYLEVPRQTCNTMSLQYLETLKNLGNSPATKFVLPMEFTSFLKPFISQHEGSAGVAAIQK